MAAPTIAAVAAAAVADAELSSSSGEGSESDEMSDGESIIAHPGASSSDFESSMIQVPIFVRMLRHMYLIICTQELRNMRGDMQRMIQDAQTLSKDMQCRRVAHSHEFFSFIITFMQQ